MPKYHNVKTTLDGMVFDSKREAARWQELKLLERAGRISGLTRQASYELAPSVKYEGEKRAKPALRLIVDFTYWLGDKVVLEDTKGVMTAVFRVKRHLLKSVWGLEVLCTK